jgi:hyperosmotically inducible protein
MKQRSYVVALTLFALASLGIARAQGNPPAKAEERIAREARHELLMLPYYGVFDSIGFKVEGYNVTLVGQMPRMR